MSRVTAQDAFSKYVQQHADSLSAIATFCHVKPETVMSWTSGTWPRGEPMYLLWAFLEFRGYTLTELDSLPIPTHQLLLIVASGTLSFEDVQQELGYQNLQDVYRLFRKATDPTRDRAFKLEALVRQHLGALDEYRRQLTTSSEVQEPPRPVRSEEPVDLAPPAPQVASDPKEPSSLARLLRLTVRRSSELPPDELKRQLREVPREEIETFALLLLELI